MKVHGQFESKAYRTFKKREHAIQFLNGSIRFGHIYKYKTIENAKLQDKTEGESHVQKDGIQYHSMFASTNIYICCFHRSMESARKAGFGPYVVKINNPKILAEEITSSLKTKEGKFYGGVEGVLVEYDKGYTRENLPDSQEMARLTYAQKPRDSYHVDNEFRYVIISKENYGKKLEISLGSKLNNCQLVIGI